MPSEKSLSGGGGTRQSLFLRRRRRRRRPKEKAQNLVAEFHVVIVRGNYFLSSGSRKRPEASPLFPDCGQLQYYSRATKMLRKQMKLHFELVRKTVDFVSHRISRAALFGLGFLY